MLQAQQQQILAQHQQFAQAGLLPPGPQPNLMPPPSGPTGPSGQPNLMPPPMAGMQTSYISSTGPFGQFTAPPPVTTGLGSSANSSSGHRRVQSSITGNHGYPPPTGSNANSNNTNAPPGFDRQQGHPGGQAGAVHGHSRRHSLALSEAKRAAAIAQARRQTNTSPSKQPQFSQPIEAGSSSNSNVPSFRFPSSPERSEALSPSPSRNMGHGRSQSLQYSNSSSSNNSNSGRYQRQTSPQRNFQFPAQTNPEITTNSLQPNEFYQQQHDRRSSNNAHQRSSSRNFESNWRQPPSNQSQDLLSSSPSNQFTPSHRSRGSYNSSVSSLSGYSYYPQGSLHGQNLGGQGGGQGQQRKSLFAPYLPQASLPGLLAEGRLVSGVLRVNKKNRSDAYVSTDGLLDADIYICGSKDRNRALEGDLVAVELLEVDEVWGSKKEKEEKKKRKDAGSSSGNADESKGGSATSGGSGSGLQRRGSLKQRPTQKKNDDVEVEGQSLLLAEEEELSDAIKPLYAGHVVAIIDRVPGQMFSGTLGLLRPSSQATKDKQDAERKEKGEYISHENIRYHDKPKIVWFKPTDKRVPLIAIPTEQAPRDFVDNHEHYSDKLFVASIKRWPITSLHPFGTLVEELGSSNDLEIELEALLRDNNFTADIFPESVNKSVTDLISNDANLSEFETSRREDFTKEYVLSFTPNGKLVDEAIHVKKLSDSTIELGVHISDLSHYVKENSPLDREAKKRGSSVFLKQRDLNLFPDEFNKFVALEAGETKATLSVLFQIDTNSFEVANSIICEGFVRPREKITYDTVDSVLSGNSEDEPSSLISQTVKDYIDTLHLLSQQFRKQRFESDNGEIGMFGLLDQVEDENVTVSSNIFDVRPVQRLLDEINIKANAAVAQEIHSFHGPRAFLRRHSEPTYQKLESFVGKMRSLGLDVDASTSASLQRSIFKINNAEIRKSLETLLYKCMSRAKYFVAAKVDPESYSHYYLNAPLYTHFTAPLRRYADLIVHRQVRSAIYQVEISDDIEILAALAESCNFKKDSARNAQEQSLHLFLCQVIAGLSSSTGQIVRDAVIIQVYESAFDVLIQEFGIEKRVHGDQLPLRKAEFNKESRLLELYWEPGVDSATFVPEDERGSRSSQASGPRRTASSAESAAAQEHGDPISKAFSNLSVEPTKGVTLAADAVAAGPNGDKTSTVDGGAAVNDEATGLNISKSLPSSPKLITDSPVPQRTSSLTEINSSVDSSTQTTRALDAYLEGVITRIDNGTDYIQQIRLLHHVPVLLRAEVGKSIPCLTVRTINPFAE